MKTQPEHGRVLLVDDDAMIRMLAAESLRHAGFEVSEADCGEQALRVFEESPFDLMLLDVLMPGIDGYTVCERLRRHPRGQWLPILMLTGLNDSESIERAYRAGATDFITKPINWLLLTQRVRYGLRASHAIALVTHSQQRLAHAQRLARMGSWEWSIAEQRFSWSDELQQIFSGDWKLAGAATPERFLDMVRESDRATVGAARQALLFEGTAYQLTYGIDRPDATLCEVFEQAVAVRDGSGRIITIEGVTQDITERVEAQRRIQHMALHDGLTGLANRQFFSQLVEVELERSRRDKSACAILYLDIDHFKTVNDALGDAAGDQLLCTLAERLRAEVRGADLLALKPPMRTAEVVARIDGDAFTVLVLEVRAASHAALVAERLLKTISLPLLLGGSEIVLTASIGIAVFPRDGKTVETLWRHAEQAMYAAKATGPSTCHFFDKEMNAAASVKLGLENALRRAIGNDELRLHFQPKVDAGSGRLIGAEALVRWQHPQRGLLGPDQFIGLAEESGLIVALGDWVVTAAARQLRQWQDAGLPPLRLSINLASPSFLQEDIADRLDDALRRAGVSPGQLLLELTESLLMVDAESTIARLNRLREKGFGLSLDDFGTGYSSLSYLKRFPLDELKIDRSFITDVTLGDKDAAIALSVIELGRRFGMQVVAEGVETRAQAGFLLAHGCPIQQGYLYSPPIAADDFAALLRRGDRFDRGLLAQTAE
ncbi:MAG: EAL domain-containing protein [Candidatus Accumulibacter sp.]|jgi:diguanylate cyclase (GGDEF)-like protein|uniref:putative bifunctional diguanylate cyclase/phosphodiesterase n=1 Tax=Candidatus Accumulibacter TaxID=327159 RepID=UPI001ACDCD45|nr:EAL domain-containing protein [Accumulibacter sp.]MBK8114118.1 EAL domain-containing protein [Accumulibacter sp.]MBN8439133.1 EAL domain-containing protein [Accumulibacter sp.]